MEIQNTTLQAYRSFLEKLEIMVYDIRDELHMKRQLREEWNSWHSMWKKAWLLSPEESGNIENILELRRKSSIHNRFK